MRIDQGHERQKAVVGNAEDSDLAVGLRNVLHQPVDGVVGIGGVVYWRGVLGAVEGAVHHIVALGAVFTADVLNYADVSVFDNDVGCVVIALERGAEMRAVFVGGEFVGVVGGAGEEN